MKLLFDENLSPRLVSALSLHWPDSTHVESLGLCGVADEVIWSYARDHSYIVVSKDDDFRAMALVLGAPPKVIWLQLGNASTSRVAELLRTNAPLLEDFAVDPWETLLSLRA